MQENAHSAVRHGQSLALTRKTPAHILIVDDDPDACEVMRLVLASEHYDTTTETSAQRALTRLEEQDFDLVLSDVTMAEKTGLELCREVVATRPETPVILLTGQGTLSTATQALRLGARDFLTKPIDAEALVFSVARALEPRPTQRRSTRPPAALGNGRPKLELTGMVGQCPAMCRLYELIAELRGSVASILLEGETGTGKEIIARAIHDNSRFKQGPFVALNCAALPEGLLESELFGHAGGAFTDAKGKKKGLLVEANGGTLLLDEIGELPLAMQPKLLRALQERKVRPLGQHEEVAFDCRLIAATNRDLRAEVAAKRFREDLYYRLDVVRVTVPPLRERGDDILLLAQYFAARAAQSSGREVLLGGPVIDKLLSHDWPGNVRELENCIEHAAALARSAELSVEDLPERIARSEPLLGPKGVGSAGPSAQAPSIMPLFELEQRHILRAIDLLGGNKTLAADMLGVDRRTLHRRLKRYETAPVVKPA